MSEVIFIAIMGLLFVWQEYNQRKLKELLDRHDSIEAEEKFYGANYCHHCHARLRIKVGPKRGEFYKECPEGCETHSLRLQIK